MSPPRGSRSSKWSTGYLEALSQLAAAPFSCHGLNMQHAFICDAIRTPFGRYGGALSTVRADDLAALPFAR